jgi:choline-sulfatase
VPERPNILLLMGDQLGARHLPVYGHPVVQAPNLTRLAKRGAVFENAYCASPLCAPSRASLLTGRLPSQTGVYDNAAELPASTPTVMHALRDAGYTTILAGKMHFVGPDQLHGFEERLTSDVYPASFDWTPDWTLPPGATLPWYHNITSLLETRVTEAAMQTDYDDEVCFTAVQLLRDLSRRPKRRPFFATVSFTNPHDPWEVRARHWQLYEDEAIDMPRVSQVDRRRADSHNLRLRDMIGIDERPLSPDEVRRARHGYYAAISYLDERIGEVLETLSATGLAGDTIVLFTADHGELLGEHGLWYKMSFLDGSARVPLIACGPGVTAQRHAAPVSQLGVAAAIASLAGVDCGVWDFGDDGLADAITGGELAAGDVPAEYLAEGANAPMVMLRRDSLVYVHAPGDPDQLHDLAADPDQLHNLATDGHPQLEGLHADALRRWDLAAVERDVLESQRRRRLVASALAHGAHTPWDYQPSTDASVRWVRGTAADNERPGRWRPRGALPGA